jgi:hypothetical protein
MAETEIAIAASVVISVFIVRIEVLDHLSGKGKEHPGYW